MRQLQGKLNVNALHMFFAFLFQSVYFHLHIGICYCRGEFIKQAGKYAFICSGYCNAGAGACFFNYMSGCYFYSR